MFVYTVFGGMWSVALTDFLQMIIIVIGLSLIAWFAADLAGGADKVIAYAASKDMFRFLPEPTAHAWLFWLGAAITIMIGSIPQQDVFQRVMSAKNADTAVKGPIIGGISYLALPSCRCSSACRAVHRHARSRRAARRGRFAEDPADTGDGAHARLAAGDVLRRAAVGHHVHGLGDAAGALDHVRREHPEELSPSARTSANCARCASPCSSSRCAC